MNRQQEKITALYWGEGGALMASYTRSPIEKWVALYVRLSRDDDNEGDSNSISHQVEILTKYAKEHGIENFKIYKDDGFSGTNFNRPGFQEMMSDIESGLVSMVVVKDYCAIIGLNQKDLENQGVLA